MKTEKSDRRQYRVHCPHCRAAAIVRSSIAITDEVRQLYLACTDTTCGHIFAAVAEVRVTITHTIAPSARPSETVALPVTVPAMRRDAALRLPRRRPANDTQPATLAPPRGPEVPRPANDDGPISEATG